MFAIFSVRGMYLPEGALLAACRGRMCDTSREAEERGIRVGSTLAEVRALHPGLEPCFLDELRPAEAFLEEARRGGRGLALTPEGALLLDLGTAGGEERVLRDLAERLVPRFGWFLDGAVGPTRLVAAALWQEGRQGTRQGEPLPDGALYRGDWDALSLDHLPLTREERRRLSSLGLFTWGDIRTLRASPLGGRRQTLLRDWVGGVGDLSPLPPLPAWITVRRVLEPPLVHQGAVLALLDEIGRVLAGRAGERGIGRVRLLLGGGREETGRERRLLPPVRDPGRLGRVLWNLFGRIGWHRELERIEVQAEEGAGTPVTGRLFGEAVRRPAPPVGERGMTVSRRERMLEVWDPWRGGGRGGPSLGKGS